MAVAFYSETSNVTPVQAKQIGDEVTRHLGGPNMGPEGGLFHADGPTPEGGWWTFDIWESDEAATRFHDGILYPAIAQAGLEPPTPRRLEVAWHTLEAPQ